MEIVKCIKKVEGFTKGREYFVIDFDKRKVAYVKDNKGRTVSLTEEMMKNFEVVEY